MTTPPTVLFLCTGNAARSVMGRAMFADRSSTYRATSAGTLVLEGHPMSQRTRRALANYDIVDSAHRSHQFGERDVDADLIVAMEPSHVAWIRRNYPEAADRTAMLKLLVRRLPGDGSLAERVAALELASAEIDPADEVIDPAGGEQPAFDACADELDQLIDRLVEVLG